VSRANLPAELHTAYEWIESAGEWREALAEPASYAKAAAKNWREHREPGDTEVTESDLWDAIEWQREHRPRAQGGPTLTEARRAELGRVRLHVRIRAESLARLDALCAESGYTRPEQIEALIDCERVTAR
jgi:hypothetical protein